MGFELECLKFIESNHEIELCSLNTESYDEIDFSLKFGEALFVVDCKEKKSRNRAMWSEISGIPLDKIFIFDETAIKKMFCHYPYAFALIKDRINLNYVVFTSLDLLVIPRRRVNRPINKSSRMYKGKWVVDLMWGHSFENIEDSFRYMLEYLSSDLDAQMKRLQCIEIPESENVPILDDDYTRTSHYWNKDVEEK